MLFEQIHSDLKNAQLQKDHVKVETLRMLLSEMTYARIQKGEELSDADILPIIQREIKKRKEGAEGFRKGGKEELAQKEEAEAKVLTLYLPEQLSDEELIKVVDEVINEVGATSVSDMGKVIGGVMGRVSGKADGGRVSALVKERITSV